MLQKKEQVYEALRRLDKVLEETDPGKIKIELVLVGGAAVIVKYGGKRWTRDVDALDRSFKLWGLGILEEYGLHLVSEALLNLHPDYEQRLEKIEALAGLKKVSVFVLGPYDLAITKIGRGLTHDLEDIAYSDLAKKLDLNRLTRLYNEAMAYWVGPETRFRQNLALALEYLRKERST